MCCIRKVCFQKVLILFVSIFLLFGYSIHAEAAGNQETITKSFAYTGGMQSYVIPKKGLYKLEVWGAQGGGSDGGSNRSNRDGYLDGGKGGYSSGYVILNKDAVLYVCVGGEGGSSYSRSSSAYAAGGYNGGGYCYGGDGCMNAAGGGATSIASISGTISQIGMANLSKIYLIAGGGGGSANGDGSWCRANGGGGGGLTGNAGYTNGSSSVAATQTGGYAFGQGTNASGNSGSGGGGGLYGGNTTGKASGGGGSGYIGGVPTVTVKNTNYGPNTVADVWQGNGKAVITLIEELEYVTMLDRNVERIEKQQVEISANYKGMVSYTWQRQEKMNHTEPTMNDWYDLDLSTDKYQIAEEDDHDVGKATLSFSVDLEDGNYWYRFKMIGENCEIVSDYCNLNVIPLKKNYLTVGTYDRTVEVGDSISVKDLDIAVVYNNEEVTEMVWEHTEWDGCVSFSIDGNYCQEYTFSHVTQDFELVIHMEDLDNPQDFVIKFDVLDHGEPEITKVDMETYDYVNSSCEKEFVIHVSANDLSDGELEYWYVRESDGQESEHNQDGNFTIRLSENDTITIYVKDESGNIKQWEQEIVFVDSVAPVILNVLMNPENEWKKGTATVTVYADDDLSGLHEYAYSFDGGINWQKENNVVLEDSAELTIVVRDLVENLSEKVIMQVNRIHEKNKPAEVQEEDLLIEDIPLDYEEEVLPYTRTIPSTHKSEKKIPIYLSEEQEKEYLIYDEMAQDKVDIIYPELKEDILFPIIENGVPLDGNEKRKYKIPVIPFTVTITATTGGATGGFVFIFFWFFRRAEIYWLSQSLEEELVGSGIINKKGKHYLLKLNAKRTNCNRSGKYIIKTSKRFCRRNKEKYLDIVLDKKVIQTLRIQENMYFFMGSRKGKKHP